MKNLVLSIVILFVVILSGVKVSVAQDFKEDQHNFYIGLGTKLSTYIGGEFGSRFGIRFANSYDPYNDRSNYYYDDEYSYYNDKETHSLNPLEFNLIGGYNINENMSMELETGISFHTNGYLDANQYTVGTEGTTQYIQHFDNSSMMMVPIMASFKYFPFGKNETPIFLSGGYGVQYVDESLDLVRDYDVYENYYYGYGTYRVRVDNYSASGWMNGFKVGTGTTLSLFGNLKTDIEINYLKFFNSNTDENSNLAFQKTSSFGNISLGTKIYFGF